MGGVCLLRYQYTSPPARTRPLTLCCDAGSGLTVGRDAGKRGREGGIEGDQGHTVGKSGQQSECVNGGGGPEWTEQRPMMRCCGLAVVRKLPSI